MSSNGLLFVYGTLKRGGQNHRELASHKPRFLGTGRIKGHLFRIKGESYPGAVPTSSPEYVRGELYELEAPKKALEKIDEFEGVEEGLFVRKLAEVWVGQEKMKAWTYFYARRKDRASRLVRGSFQVKLGRRKKATH
jgi:gamma-glutamylaminecyclotransferase